MAEIIGRIKYQHKDFTNRDSCQPNDQMWQFQCSLLPNNFDLNIVIRLAYVTLLSGIASAKPCCLLNIFYIYALPFFPYSFRPLRNRAPKTQLGVWVSAVSFPNPQWGLWGSGANLVHRLLESKSAALVAAVFVDFPENKCTNSCLRSNCS